MRKSPKFFHPQVEQAKLLRSLMRLEDGLGMSFIAENQEPLDELVSKAQSANNEDEYWRLWEQVYLRLQWILPSKNALRDKLAQLDAPIYLEREMENYWNERAEKI